MSLACHLIGCGHCCYFLIGCRAFTFRALQESNGSYLIGGRGQRGGAFPTMLRDWLMS